MEHKSPEQQMMEEFMAEQDEEKEGDSKQKGGKIVLTMTASDAQMERDLEACFGGFGWSDGFVERAVEQTSKQLKRNASYEINSISTESDHKVTIISYRPDLDREVVEKPDMALRHALTTDQNTEVICNGAPEGLSLKYVEHILANCELLTFAGDDGGLSLRPGADEGLIERVLDAVRHTERTEDGTEIIEKVWQGGRPPLGTEIDDGRLVKSDNYRDVSRTILLVQRDEISISEAARRLDCTRKTVTNIIDERADMYAVVGQ